ncbi:MAG: class I SAM-dependent methyltransferase [Parcubacteria group bacterium]|nr:class I SAM-dependent methyltransferase [Parcubacteria group bacterium]MCR4342529.1 class I SAM-dependent methyltransferase [Patescibacteria group bacterium]
MAVIFQPDRILLKEQIKKYRDHIKGIVLDAGAGGFDRYSELFSFEKYLKLDIDEANNPDVIGSVEDIPLPDNSVDSIVSMQVLGDVENLDKAILEFHRVLKPRGAILVTESLISAIHDEPVDFWRFTDFLLKNLFEKNGFEIVLIEARGGFFASVTQSIIRYLIDRLDLYNNFLGKILRFPISIFGRIMLWIDRRDRSKASLRQTMGWCLVAVKK